MSKALVVAALMHVALASAYVVSTPAFEGPDENDHWFYAWQLANSGRIPVMRFTANELGRPVIDEAGLAHHPPLYYTLLAGAIALADRADTVGSQLAHAKQLTHTPEGAFLWAHGADENPPVSKEIRFLRLLRSGSVLCGLLSLAFTWLLGRLAFPRRPAVADVAVLALAALPAWSFNHAVLENGALATTFAHAMLAVLCAAIAAKRFDARIVVATSALLGLCLVTKLTTVALVPLVGVVALAAALRQPSRARAFGLVALGGVIVAAIAGWFFVRNIQLYGDPLGSTAYQRVYASNMVPVGRALEWIRFEFLPRVFTSLLGQFGPWTVPPREALVTFGKVIAALAACGAAFCVARPRGDANKPVVVVLVGAAALAFLATLQFNLTFRQPQGRYLFPGIGPMAVLFAAGLVRLATPLPQRARQFLGVAFGAGVIGIGLLVYDKTYVPAFDRSLVPAPALFASLTTGCTARAAQPGLEILGPDEAARLDAPPTLRWTPLDDPAARYALYVFTPAGRIYLATHEWLQQEIEGGAFAVPAVVWESLPQDVELVWNVRRIADRTKRELPREMQTGAGRSFVRVHRGAPAQPISDMP